MVRAMSALFSVAAAKTVMLATFDGAKETTLSWRPVNDPVMGGQSKSTFDVESPKGIFEGEVKVVPFLGSAGFCNLETQGSVSFPDVSGTDGITVEAMQTLDGGLENFNARFSTKQTNAARSGAAWEADFEVKEGQASHFVPYSAFTCRWRGQKLSTCGNIAEQLSDVTQLAVGSDGVAGKFRLELTSIAATSASLAADASEVPLTTFDGAEATTQKWNAMNDPVMGGKSKATFTVDGDAAVFDGAVAIVPSLNAPGFCTMQSNRGSFPDISEADALEIVAKQTTDYKGWRFTIGDGPRNPDSGAPFFVRGQYKANVAIPVSEEFQTVTIPFTDFTYKWSDTTGEPTVKCVDDPSVCPTAKYLKSPKQLAIMAEGLEGSFHLEVKSIKAVKSTSVLV